MFKKGDPVICSDYGIGYVIGVKTSICDYPVKVEFMSDNSIVFYTADGRSVKDSDITLKIDTHDWRP